MKMTGYSMKTAACRLLKKYIKLRSLDKKGWNHRARCLAGHTINVPSGIGILIVLVVHTVVHA